jgi:hypothetical protein
MFVRGGWWWRIDNVLYCTVLYCTVSIILCTCFTSVIELWLYDVVSTSYFVLSCYIALDPGESSFCRFVFLDVKRVISRKVTVLLNLSPKRDDWRELFSVSRYITVVNLVYNTNSPTHVLCFSREGFFLCSIVMIREFLNLPFFLLKQRATKDVFSSAHHSSTLNFLCSVLLICMP